jgi:hypothetical protein
MTPKIWYFSGILSWQSGILGKKIVGNAAASQNPSEVAPNRQGQLLMDYSQSVLHVAH